MYLFFNIFINKLFKHIYCMLTEISENYYKIRDLQLLNTNLLGRYIVIN